MTCNFNSEIGKNPTPQFTKIQLINNVEYVISIQYSSFVVTTTDVWNFGEVIIEKPTCQKNKLKLPEVIPNFLSFFSPPLTSCSSTLRIKSAKKI